MEDAMTRTFAAAIFTLLAVTTPSHAATVDELNATIDLNFPSTGTLTGTLDLTINPYYYSYLQSGAMGGDPPIYSINGSSLSINGTPLILLRHKIFYRVFV